MSQKKNSFTDEFKSNIVKLYHNGKSAKQLAEEYKLASSTIYKWLKESESTGSFKAKDNRSIEEQKIIKLEKQLKLAQRENDILKQAALLLGKK